VGGVPTRVLFALLCAAASVTACGDGGQDTTTEATEATEATEDGLLAFEAPSIDGSVVDVGSLTGEDLAIWFWAPW
jgi:hypothetical protein